MDGQVEPPNKSSSENGVDGGDGARLVGPPNRARTSERARGRAAALLNTRLAEGVHQPFLHSLHRFQGSMTTLRQLNRKLTSTVANWPDEIMEEFREAIQGYAPEQQKSLLELAAKASLPLLSGTLIFRAKQQSDSEGSTEQEAEQEDDVAEAWQVVADRMDGDMGAAYEVLHLLYMRSTTPELAQTFHRSLLVSAVAALDVLLLELISRFYLLRPEVLGGEATFTLEDLSAFSDLSEARADAVEKKADSVVRSGLEGWVKWLKERKIDLKTHCADFARFVEIVQRRHIAVHNDGRVSRAYLKKINELGGTTEGTPELGTRLSINAEYLDAALDELEAVGNLVTGAVWTKALDDAEEVVIFELYVRSYDLLLAERWLPTARICTMARQRLKPEDDLYLIHLVNAWLSRKRMGEDITSEVQDWPTKTLGTRFQAAQAALLDDNDKLDELIRKCLRAGDLGIEEAWEWPLFADFRKLDRWQDIVSSFAKGAD